MKIKRKAVQAKKPVVDVTPTGSTTLDLALGGGLAWGKIVNIVGDRSTGKTLLACEIVAVCKLILGDKFNHHFDDAECGFSFDTVAMYDYEMLPEDGYRSMTVEDFMTRISRSVKDAREAGIERWIGFVDSFDALSSEAEMGRHEKMKAAKEAGTKFDEGTYNLEKQRQINQFFRTELKSMLGDDYMLIVISQTRENIGVSFRKPKRHCENVLNFYSDQIIWLSETEKYRSKGRVTGISVKAQINKNKIGKPFREAFFDILFDYGVDDIAGNVDYFFDLKTDTGKSRKDKVVEWDDKTFKNRGKLIQYIDDNKQGARLKKQVVEKWNKIEDEIAPKRKPKYA
jgi:recombination protein RecA